MVIAPPPSTPHTHTHTQMTKKIIRTLETTRFAGCPVVAVAAKPGGPEAPPTECALGVDELITVN